MSGSARAARTFASVRIWPVARSPWHSTNCTAGYRTSKPPRNRRGCCRISSTASSACRWPGRRRTDRPCGQLESPGRQRDQRIGFDGLEHPQWRGAFQGATVPAPGHLGTPAPFEVVTHVDRAKSVTRLQNRMPPPVSVCFAEFRCGSWVGGSCRARRRSASSRSPAGVMVNPRQPALARSNTAHTNDKQDCSPGRRPITRFAVGIDAPGGQHRLGRGVGVVAAATVTHPTWQPARSLAASSSSISTEVSRGTDWLSTSFVAP